MNFGIDYQGGGGGGGYNPDTSFGGGGGSQDSGKKERRSYDEQTVIPVTIDMAIKSHTDTSSGDGSLVLEDGRALHTIKLVAAVRNVDDMSTNVLYTVEDGTGVVDVKQWIDDNDASAVMEMRQQTTKDNIYIKVVGQIKDYEGKKLIVANSVRLLSTGNELTHHFLEVMYVAEKFKRADAIVPFLPAPPQTLLGGIGNTFADGFGGREDLSKNRVMALMRQHDTTEEGVSIDFCVQMLSDIPEPEIRKAVEVLAEEGCVYSTINENHYKVAA